MNDQKIQDAICQLSSGPLEDVKQLSVLNDLEPVEIVLVFALGSNLSKAVLDMVPILSSTAFIALEPTHFLRAIEKRGNGLKKSFDLAIDRGQGSAWFLDLLDGRNWIPAEPTKLGFKWKLTLASLICSLNKKSPHAWMLREYALAYVEIENHRIEAYL